MGVYLLSYDLVDEKKNAQHDYQVLWDELKRLGAHRTQLSVWLVNINLDPVQVIRHFAKFVDGNDRLWAATLFKGTHYRQQAYAGTQDWLNANLP
jgi:hypothetical protein